LLIAEVWTIEFRTQYSPHCRAVEIHKHPLVRVEVEGVCALDSRHEVSELRTDESRACRHQTRIVNIDSHRPIKVRAVEVKGKYGLRVVGKFV